MTATLEQYHCHLANAHVFRACMDQPVYTDDPGIEDLQLDLIGEEYRELLEAFKAAPGSRSLRMFVAGLAWRAHARATTWALPHASDPLSCFVVLFPYCCSCAYPIVTDDVTSHVQTAVVVLCAQATRTTKMMATLDWHLVRTLLLRKLCAPSRT